ncbi:MAG: cold shock domain-containing protein [Phycisphaerales bacterium]|nr:cold shock domain-containing protein [Phycisphaerales bacterium]
MASGQQSDGNQNSPDPIHEIEGVVKWFDPRKGFGFIVGPQNQDIFLHFTVIEQSEGFRTVRDGERVVYSARESEKGWSATLVRSLGSRVPRAERTNLSNTKDIAEA